MAAPLLLSVVALALPRRLEPACCALALLSVGASIGRGTALEGGAMATIARAALPLAAAFAFRAALVVCTLLHEVRGALLVLCGADATLLACTARRTPPRIVALILTRGVRAPL
jgi:hypothetical protein